LLSIAKQTDYISPESVNNLRELFQARVELSANMTAYEYYSDTDHCWKKISWRSCENMIQLWASALKKEGFKKGDRVAILIKNSLEWVIFEQASFACGLVVVPLYTEDRAENIAYILENSDAQCIFLEGNQHWDILSPIKHKFNDIKRILSLETIDPDKQDPRILTIEDWTHDIETRPINNTTTMDNLASIVYTSGTTGKAKGVMLSHGNIIEDAWAGVHSIDIYPYDHFLSFLPMSHMLERTIGYYLPMLSGSKVSFSRSITDLAEDFLSQNPSLLISVPRIFERVYLKVEQAIADKGKILKAVFNYAIALAWQKFMYTQHKQKWKLSFLLLPVFDRLFFRKIREKFGNNFRFAISGGAALEYHIAQLFISVGINIAQGYGLTEFSPVISVNRLDDNDPRGVGEPLPGVEIKIGNNDELLVRGKSLMQGYWKNDKATKEAIDSDGWLHTGDQARISNNKIYITGRLKDIIVLSNGEKIPPGELEQAIIQDPFFENVIVIGEGRPYLSALVIPNHEMLKDNPDITETLLNHIQIKMEKFPGYARIHKISICKTPWTIENGMLTPTLKPRRKSIINDNQECIEAMYKGH